MSPRLRGLLMAAVLALVAVSMPAQEPMTLSCAPDCRGIDLTNATLTGVNLNRVNLVNANWSART